MVARVALGCLTIGFGLVALQSCTAVLGMERATLDLSADGSAGGGQGGSGNASSTFVAKTNRCKEQPTQACTDCLRQNCPSDYDTCIGDPACRITLNKYALCIGDTCRIRPLEECATLTLDDSMTACAAGCEAACSYTTLVDQCTLYCACMPTCATGIYATTYPDDPFVTGGDCMQKCRADNNPALAECLRSHCEFATAAKNARDDDHLLMHCEHATGRAAVCVDTPPTPPNARCLDRSENGWACKAGSECCSTRCSPTTMVCD